MKFDEGKKVWEIAEAKKGQMRFVAYLEVNKEEIASILFFERVFVLIKKKFCFALILNFTLKFFWIEKNSRKIFFLQKFCPEKIHFTFVRKILFLTKESIKSNFLIKNEIFLFWKIFEIFSFKKFFVFSDLRCIKNFCDIRKGFLKIWLKSKALNIVKQNEKHKKKAKKFIFENFRTFAF